MNKDKLTSIFLQYSDHLKDRIRSDEADRLASILLETIPPAEHASIHFTHRRSFGWAFATHVQRWYIDFVPFGVPHCRAYVKEWLSWNHDTDIEVSFAPDYPPPYDPST